MQSPRSIALQCCGGLSRAAIGLSREGCWAKGQQAWLGSAAVSTRTPHHHPDSWCWWSYWSLWSCYWVSTQRRSLLNFVPKYCHLLRQWPWHRTDSKMSDKKCLGPRLWSVKQEYLHCQEHCSSSVVLEKSRVSPRPSQPNSTSRTFHSDPKQTETPAAAAAAAAAILSRFLSDMTSSSSFHIWQAVGSGTIVQGQRRVNWQKSSTKEKPFLWNEVIQAQILRPCIFKLGIFGSPCMVHLPFPPDHSQCW